MDVHSHTHTARKKWSHYFWEFLMLFLAVFCGFLAENKREHIVEKHRAKDYAKSLLADLKADIKELETGITFTKFHIDCIDKLYSIQLDDMETVPGEFYFYSRFSSNTYTIDWNRSTLQQLVQSGNLRYFRDKNLVTLINEYFSIQESISSFNLTDLQHRNLLTELRNRIIRPKLYAIFSKVSPRDVVDSLPLGSVVDSLRRQRLSIQPGSYMLLESFLNHLGDRKWRLGLVVDTYYPKAIEKANAILTTIKDNYHID